MAKYTTYRDARKLKEDLIGTIAGLDDDVIWVFFCNGKLDDWIELMEDE